MAELVSSRQLHRGASAIGDETGEAEVWEQLLARPAWHAMAACRFADPSVFFPPRGASVLEAKSVCAGCEVRVECSEAGKDEKYGIWGGRSERQRRTMRRRAAPSPYVAAVAQ